jgi:hypothetical protein
VVEKAVVEKAVVAKAVVAKAVVAKAVVAKPCPGEPAWVSRRYWESLLVPEIKVPGAPATVCLPKALRQGQPVRQAQAAAVNLSGVK